MKTLIKRVLASTLVLISCSYLSGRSTHYLIRSAFLTLRLSTTNVSDVVNARKHAKWMWMCARIQIIRNAYDVVPASRLVLKMRSIIGL